VAQLDVAGEERRLAPEVELGLFRIVQEALNNTRKHASAHTVRVDLKIAAGLAIQLIITDDGHGFDTTALPAAFADNLVALQTLTREMVGMLECAVQAKLNILISGGTGTGKTTLLNILSSFIGA